MSTHTIQTEIEVEVAEINRTTAYPILEITFDYIGDKLFFRAAKLVNADALDPDSTRLEQWAEAFLAADDGRAYAIDCAELDLLAMRHAHLEAQRDQ